MIKIVRDLDRAITRAGECIGAVARSGTIIAGFDRSVTAFSALYFIVSFIGKSANELGSLGLIILIQSFAALSLEFARQVLKVSRRTQALTLLARVPFIHDSVSSAEDWALAVSDGWADLRSQGNGRARCMLWAAHQITLLVLEGAFRLPLLSTLSPDLPRYLASGLRWAGGTGALVYMLNLIMVGGATWRATKPALFAFVLTWLTGTAWAWMKDTRAASRLPSVIVRRVSQQHDE